MLLSAEAEREKGTPFASLNLCKNGKCFLNFSLSPLIKTKSKRKYNLGKMLHLNELLLNSSLGKKYLSLTVCPSG